MFFLALLGLEPCKYIFLNFDHYFKEIICSSKTVLKRHKQKFWIITEAMKLLEKNIVQSTFRLLGCAPSSDTNIVRSLKVCLKCNSNFFFRNPESYEAKMKFWTQAIEKWMDSNKTYKFKISDLNFQANSRRPLCLEDVIEEMLTNKKLIEKEEFIKSLNDSSWSDFTWKLVKAGTSFLTTALSPKNSKVNKISENSEFIHLSKLEQRAEATLIQIKDIGNDYCKKSDILEVDPQVEMVLEYMKHRAIVDFTPIQDDIYIKPGSKINDYDLAKIHLELNMLFLETKLVEKDHELRQKKVALKNCIAQGNSKTKAKFMLREIKYLSANNDKMDGQLFNLKKVYDELDRNIDNKRVVESLQVAKKALNSQKIQDKDKVEDLLEDIKELIQDNQEMSDILGEQDSELNDEDLERELNQLLEDENEKELQEALNKLIVTDEKIEKPQRDPKKKEPIAL